MLQPLEQAEKVPVRVFYTKHSSLTVNVNPGKIYHDLERNTRVLEGAKLVQFTEQGDGYGRLVTDDPEVIANLEKRGDVMTSQQYEKAIIPLKIQVSQLEDENKRVVLERNELLRQLAEKKTAK